MGRHQAKRAPLCEKTNVNVTMATKKQTVTRSCSARNKENSNGNSSVLPQNTNTTSKKNNLGREIKILIERSPHVEKQLKRKLACAIIQKPSYNKCLNVSIERNSVVEKEVSRKMTRAANQKAKLFLQNIQSLINDSSVLDESKLKEENNDIYEFTFDPLDETVNKKNLKHLMDDSGDSDNSMKGVLKNIRKNELKKKTTNKRTRTIPQKKKTNILTEDKASNRSTKAKTQICTKVVEVKIVQNENSTVSNEINDSQPFEKPTANMTLPEIIAKSFSEEFNDTYTHINSSPILNDKVLKSLRDSFIPNNISNNMKCITVTQTPNINIISDIIVSSPSKTNQGINALDRSNPWRLSVSNSRNPHSFTVKQNSLVPNYDQDIVINSTLSDKLNRKPVSKSSDKEYPREATFQQTSILDFVDSSKTILNTTLFTSPRKVLGEINFQQSTPFHPKASHIVPEIDLDISNIGNDSSRNNISDLFGFTCDENDENFNPMLNKANRKSIRRVKELKKVLFNEEVKVANQDETQSQEIESLEHEISAADVEMLFQDVEDTKKKLVVKKSRFSYERVRPKRKRLPSWHESESEPEEEDQQIERKKYNKTANKRTRAEEEEVDKLAAHYNSMFEEIDQHTLLIDDK